jgi:outer membrane protein assembly factor BamA
MQWLKTSFSVLRVMFAKQMFLSAIVLSLFFVVQKATAQNYKICFHEVDSSNINSNINIELPKKELSEEELHFFLKKLIPELQKQGFLEASVDTVFLKENQWQVFLFTGKKYKFTYLSFESVPEKILQQLGINESEFVKKEIEPKDVTFISDEILKNAERLGYPFARVSFKIDSFSTNNIVFASLRFSLGKLVRLDTIIVHGDVRIAKSYLFRLLSLNEKGVYNQRAISSISQKLKSSVFLKEKKPSDVFFAKEQTSLNIYLEERKSNQINAIIGLLPNAAASAKMLLTVDALLALRNGLGYGEELVFSFQNLQYQSPKLKLDFVYPFVFHSRLGVDFHFELYKRDTAWQRTFFQAGIRYQFHGNDFVRLYFHQQANRLIVVDTNWIKTNKQLPANIDATAFGLGAEINLNRTDNFINPKSGFEFQLSCSQLSSIIRRNTAIENIVESGFSFSSLYDTAALSRNQFLLKTQASYYFKISKQFVLKTSLYSGLINSENLFQNDLYQIGGYKLLRGFNEQSIFGKEYYVSSFEARIPFDDNSYFFLFNDNCYVVSTKAMKDYEGWYHGFGLGVVLQLKNGLFNLSYSVGTSPQTTFQIRDAKIHFGFVSLF